MKDVKCIPYYQYKQLLKENIFPVQCNTCFQIIKDDCYFMQKQNQVICKACYQKFACHSVTSMEVNMRESDLIHYSLNLTSAMKKSYKKSSEDEFSIDQFNIRTLNVSNTSLSTLNIHHIKKVIEYIAEIENELKRRNKKITYKDVRYELQKRKTINLVQLRNTKL